MNSSNHISLQLVPPARIFIVGVGGSGMSGLAKMAAEAGYTVAGSDGKLANSAYLAGVAEAGVQLLSQHSSENIQNFAPDLVVITGAIPANNAELQYAKQHDIPIVYRAEFLSYLLKDKQQIVVSGTHGKTTTTSMLLTALTRLAPVGSDPSYYVGGVVSEFGATAAYRTGNIAVIEADESDGSLVNFTPHIAIITNIEADHMDNFDSIEQIEQVFSGFIDKVEPCGTLIVCADDERAVSLSSNAGASIARLKTYGFTNNADLQIKSFGFQTAQYTLCGDVKDSVTVDFTDTFGSVVQLDAGAAILALIELGYSLKEAAHACACYKGAQRRFETLGYVNEVRFVDDYAHHPTEIRATLNTARQLAGEGRVIALFQPHRYSRLNALWSEFLYSFAAADVLYVLPIYTAGEAPITDITAQRLADEISAHSPAVKVVELQSDDEVFSLIPSELHHGDLIVSLGAGTNTHIIRKLYEQLC